MVCVISFHLIQILFWASSFWFETAHTEKVLPLSCMQSQINLTLTYLILNLAFTKVMHGSLHSPNGFRTHDNPLTWAFYVWRERIPILKTLLLYCNSLSGWQSQREPWGFLLWLQLLLVRGARPRFLPISSSNVWVRRWWF